MSPVHPVYLMNIEQHPTCYLVQVFSDASFLRWIEHWIESVVAPAIDKVGPYRLAP